MQRRPEASDTPLSRKRLPTVFKMKDRSGPLDLLVCNAAYQEKKGFFETDLALIRRTLEVNILAWLEGNSRP